MKPFVMQRNRHITKTRLSLWQRTKIEQLGQMLRLLPKERRQSFEDAFWCSELDPLPSLLTGEPKAESEK